MANEEKIARIVRQVLAEERAATAQEATGYGSPNRQTREPLSEEDRAYNGVLDDVLATGQNYPDGTTTTLGEVRRRINGLRRR